MPSLVVRSALLAAVVVTAGCGAARFVPPSGPSAPAPDATQIWDAASASCRQTRSYQAALGISGQIDRRRVPGLAGATINVAIGEDLALGLEARAAGQLIFRLGGTPARATLLWRENNRVLIAPMADIIEALIGVPMDAARLRAVLAGCVTVSGQMTSAARYDRTVAIVTPDATVYVTTEQGRWRPRAGRFEGFTVSYPSVGDDLPRQIRIDADAGRDPAVALTLSVNDATRNAVIPAAAFVVSVPDGATPMTLGELRQWRAR